MTAWLTRHKDRLPSQEIWGDTAQRAITFVDLRRWLKERDREAEVKKYEGKGKKKAPLSPTKPKPKKHDDRDKTLVKRKHKKIMNLSDSDEGAVYL
ncbi:hypothetical protein K443DRAFT_8417 [Laccaria amethystina LaAM-08-1]|uniref:Uncharacterized protein n=1 Tax=Laccaria amethystina LaAM-08-1 TaxID=1095629 RepID=A0A0C9XPF9_9AGAR|nr:hypothetical protein K443DRAFT_8417 [Laccaria amethystina LaAM-08-1]